MGNCIWQPGDHPDVICIACKRRRGVPIADAQRTCVAGEPRPVVVIEPAPVEGPGRELTALFASLDLTGKKACKCEVHALQMNRWGVEDCKENRAVIIGWLREAYDTTTWLERRKSELAALATGLAFKINWLDPIPSLVDEAIRRAESNQPK